MKRISDQLSSLHFTTWTVVVLFLWFTWGILLAGNEVFSREFLLMSSAPLRHWIVDPLQGTFLIKFWFVGLCLVMVVLSVNLIFCSWTKILRIIRVRLSGSKLLMLIIHIVFGLVALGHFGSFMLGYRHEGIRLGQGQTFCFEDDYKLTVTKVHFIDDPMVFNKSRRELTADQFHYRSNFAEVVLSRNQQEAHRDRIYILKPLRHGNIQITLKRFIPLSKNSRLSSNDKSPGVMFVVSKNPVVWIFLALYPLMIIGIMIYLVMTWRVSPPNRQNQKHYKQGENENEG